MHHAVAAQKNLFSLSNRKLSFSIPYRSGCQWIFDETPLDKYGISIEMPIVKCASPISSFLLQSGIAGNPPITHVHSALFSVSEKDDFSLPESI